MPNIAIDSWDDAPPAMPAASALAPVVDSSAVTRQDILQALLQQLLHPSATGQAGPEQQTDAIAWQDVMQCLCAQPRVWNALHELTETVYDVGSYQLTQLGRQEQALLQQSLLIGILQQGRVLRYPVVTPLASGPACLPEVSSPTANSSGNSADSHTDNSKQTSNPAADTLQPADSDESSQDKKMPYFQIPNARAGQPYQGSIKTQGADAQQVLLNSEHVVLAEDIGICYNPESNSFEGVPSRAGEFEIRFQYQNNQSREQQWLEGSCTFIVTADPRSLWQVKEPGPDEPYQKPHRQQQLIQAGGFSMAAASRRGRSHEHAGSFRDDEVYVQQVAGTDWSIMLVADGAGSAPFSREGSRLAVQEAATVLAQFIEQQHAQLDAQLAGWQIGSQAQATVAITNGLYKEFYDLFYRVAQQAIQRIDQEATYRGVASKAFATTLLAVVVRQTDSNTFVSSFWVGDGAIAVYSPQKMRLMGTPDAGEFAGQTRFLDKSIVQQFNQRVNIGYYDNIHAVILLTDGVSDPRFETDAGLASQQKWDALWHEWQPSLSHPEPDAALLEWMHFFQSGHHDDRSLAVLWRPELVQAAVDVPAVVGGEGA